MREKPDGPTIAGDVWHTQEQAMFACTKVQQPQTQERTIRQIKTLTSLLLRCFFRASRLFSLRKVAQIDKQKIDGCSRVDNLNRLPVDHVKRRTQYFMSPHDLAQTLL